MDTSKLRVHELDELYQHGDSVLKAQATARLATMQQSANSQQQGNDLAAPEPLANTDAANPPEAIEDKLNEILDLLNESLFLKSPQDKIPYKLAKSKLQAIITTETTKAAKKAWAEGYHKGAAYVLQKEQK